MTDKLQQTIDEELIKLPIVIQNAINFSNWVQTTEEIGAKFNLNNDEINNLELEVGLILLGYKKLNLLPATIESSLIISEKNSVIISEELDKRIFTPVEQSIQELLKKEFENKIISWDQSINFIVSGGDYSVFLDKPINITTEFNS